MSSAAVGSLSNLWAYISGDNILDLKQKAENYLRLSGLNYLILRYTNLINCEKKNEN